MAQKTYKDQIAELYGNGQQTGTGQRSNAMLDLILSRKPFSYDPSTDPAAQAARKQTAREVQRTTADTLGSYAGMTGGMPSTAAVSAAAQAGNYAATQGADKVAELRQLAYQNYQTEGDNMNNMLALLQQQEDSDYDKQLAMAQLKAQYGDLSGLKELGVDTSKYSTGSSSSYTPGSTDKAKDTPADDPDGEAYNQLLVSYPGGTIPAAHWASLAAQYGEGKLIAWGFRKGQSSTGSANTGKTGGDSIRAGKFRMDLME